MTTKHRAEALADWIKDTEFYDNPNPELNDKMDEVEAMLRQQQTEIEALKERLCAYEHDDDEPLKEVRPWTPEEIDRLRQWAIDGDLKNAKKLLEQSGYKVQEPSK